MKKILKYLLAVLSTAWNGALTIFLFIVTLNGLISFANRFLNGNVISYVILAVVLIAMTMGVGMVVKEKLGEGSDR